MKAVLRFLVLCLACSMAWGASLTLQIEPKEQECFYEQLERGNQFSMKFEATRGGLLDVKLLITDPNEHVLFEKLAFFNRQNDALNDAEGRINFVAQTTGIYKVCFDNRMSRWTAKVVKFEMQHAAEKPAQAELAQLSDLGPVVDSIIKISDTLNEAEKIQLELRVVEQSARDSADNTNARVQYLAIVESVLLFSISFIQLRYIRNWFDSGRTSRV